MRSVGFGVPVAPSPASVDNQIDSLMRKAIKRTKSALLLEGDNDAIEDQFWSFMDKALALEFAAKELKRFRLFVEMQRGLREVPKDVYVEPYRGKMHSYFPGLTAQPFWEADEFPWIKELESAYPKIREEYLALLEAGQRHDSVTGINYESGWSSLQLWRNGRPVDGFPLYLCPTLARLLESIPVAQRICVGFNRQKPHSGIPLHVDGNNLMLTTQLGVLVPTSEDGGHYPAWIRVGAEKRHWQPGRALVYDTTFQHETFNPTDDERHVLHIDFWHKDLTAAERRAIERLYTLREMFLEAVDEI
ncbi:unnamed protein product [Vitrella brassicaformis CCMP3155]|uniref:Aspartyl/asparaginy/proline hydroxylase domain-containing protein n=2 Tax=Vitrella brassicaformis TaxID=1169539 RepID=A0A0G4ENV9_VITBC|nr:unnamed protein product [Vitrella brassicaformis CCMP3155]|eukprot:CEL99480.1 unnamed protein product [Vitrella brassicaformis CCMP3155]